MHLEGHFPPAAVHKLLTENSIPNGLQALPVLRRWCGGDSRGSSQRKERPAHAVALPKVMKKRDNLV